jgi:hypothetical protein
VGQGKVEMTMEPNEEFSGKERKVRKEEVGATGWSPCSVAFRHRNSNE